MDKYIGQPNKTVNAISTHCCSSPTCTHAHKSKKSKTVIGLAMKPEVIDPVFATEQGRPVVIPLPENMEARGMVELREEEGGEVVMLQGALTSPDKGRFFFRKQKSSGVAGSLVGLVYFDDLEDAYRVEPMGEDQSPVLVKRHISDVLCHNYKDVKLTAAQLDMDPTLSAEGDEFYDGPIPELESLPGAKAVLYLDFDGEEGPHNVFGDFDADPWIFNESDITETWRRVSEDYRPFNFNVTTSLDVYLAAEPTSRQRCIITTSQPFGAGYGGLAAVGSFNWGGDTPCWVTTINRYVDTTAQTISHEIGHTLNLGHDGGDTATWRPIMAPSGYWSLNRLITWTDGTHLGATSLQDDIDVIANQNNVGYRHDEHGESYATASVLDVDSAGNFSITAIIHDEFDVDSFAIVTTGGDLQVNANTTGVASSNMNLLLEVYDEFGTLVGSDDPENSLDASLTLTLAAGNYEIRVQGTGNGDPTGDPNVTELVGLIRSIDTFLALE